MGKQGGTVMKRFNQNSKKLSIFCIEWARALDVVWCDVFYRREKKKKKKNASHQQT